MAAKVQGETAPRPQAKDPTAQVKDAAAARKAAQQQKDLGKRVARGHWTGNVRMFKPEGRGVYTYDNGDVYDGPCKVSCPGPHRVYGSGLRHAGQPDLRTSCRRASAIPTFRASIRRAHTKRPAARTTLARFAPPPPPIPHHFMGCFVYAYSTWHSIFPALDPEQRFLSPQSVVPMPALCGQRTAACPLLLSVSFSPHVGARRRCGAQQHVKDLFHGKGRLWFPDGTSTRMLDWDKGVTLVERHTFKDGSIYSGGLLQVALHGRGSILFASGDSYEGELRQGRFAGSGTYVAAGGEWYRGTFKGGWEVPPPLPPLPRVPRARTHTHVLCILARPFPLRGVCQWDGLGRRRVLLDIECETMRVREAARVREASRMSEAKEV